VVPAAVRRRLELPSLSLDLAGALLCAASCESPEATVAAVAVVGSAAVRRSLICSVSTASFFRSLLSWETLLANFAITFVCFLTLGAMAGQLSTVNRP
jgi:hypothetical protein